jgi:hypothetical protein
MTRGHHDSLVKGRFQPPFDVEKDPPPISVGSYRLPDS